MHLKDNDSDMVASGSDSAPVDLPGGHGYSIWSESQSRLFSMPHVKGKKTCSLLPVASRVIFYLEKFLHEKCVMYYNILKSNQKNSALYFSYILCKTKILYDDKRREMPCHPQFQSVFVTLGCEKLIMDKTLLLNPCPINHLHVVSLEYTNVS